MSNKVKTYSACLLLLMPAILPAQVFEWFDEQGRHHYSDRKHENAEILTVNPGPSYYTVEKVFDGDTILLENGQKVRLLGINTPEVAGPHKNAESGGETAKAWLKQKLERKKVRLELDTEKQDKYQRTLAHLFTDDKQHINQELVRQGLATVTVHPPNLKHVDALFAAQQHAEQERLGIWQDPAYAPRDVKSLNPDDYKGWKRLTGRIRDTKTTQKYTYLQFSDKTSVRVENKLLNLFPNIQDYVGKQVEARGWPVKQKDRFFVPVHHPGELKILTR